MKLAKRSQISMGSNVNSNLQSKAVLSTLSKPQPQNYDFVDFIKRAKKSQITNTDVVVKEQQVE